MNQFIDVTNVISSTDKARLKEIMKFNADSNKNKYRYRIYST